MVILNIRFPKRFHYAPINERYTVKTSKKKTVVIKNKKNYLLFSKSEVP